MAMRTLLAAFTALSLCAHTTAYAADNSAQTIVHMLDYISVDYPSFVKDGKVVSETEYQEQQEFAAQAAVLLAGLPAIAEQAALRAQAEQLKTRIAAKAPGSEISAMATVSLWAVRRCRGYPACRCAPAGNPSPCASR